MGQPRPKPPAAFGQGPGGLLGSLLPRSLDTEDLLILAILVLTLRSDGADVLTMALAAGLYLLLGG